MRSHEIDYELHGDDMQMVEVELDPGEVVIAEAGAMNWMEEDIYFEAKPEMVQSLRKAFLEKCWTWAKEPLRVNPYL